MGATFGGDVDEGRPVIKLVEEDMTYSKSADGTGIGFGQVTYTQSGKKQEISLLMHMQGNQITELQVGKVRDTSGSGENRICIRETYGGGAFQLAYF
ncbi:hypothetical protein ACG92U_03045 [Leuconostoc citreum]